MCAPEIMLDSAIAHYIYRYGGPPSHLYVPYERFHAFSSTHASVLGNLLLYQNAVDAIIELRADPWLKNNEIAVQLATS